MQQLIQQWNQIKAQLEVVELGVGQIGLTPTCLICRKSDGYFYQGVSGWSATVTPLTMTPVDATNFPGLYEYAVSTDHLTASDAGEGYRVKMIETTYSILEYVDIKEAPSTQAVGGAVWGLARAGYDDAGTFGEGVRVNVVNTDALTAASFADDSITADAFAANAITPGTLATDAISAASLSAAAVEKAAAGVWNAQRADHVAVGTMGLFLQLIGGAVQINQRLKNLVYDSGDRLTSATISIYPSASAAQADSGALKNLSLVATYDSDGNMQSFIVKE